MEPLGTDEVMNISVQPNRCKRDFFKMLKMRRKSLVINDLKI